MKSSSKWALTLAAASGAAAAAALLASGFPRRVGLTRSEVTLSLPGDLLLPMAPLQADRATRVTGSAAQLWPEMLRLEENYEELWGRSLNLVFDQNAEAAAWVTAPDDRFAWTASLAVCALPDVDGAVRLRVRERYSEATPAARRAIRASALLAPLLWAKVKRENDNSKVNA